MRYVEVAGQRLSVIGLGCWQFGSREWGYGSNYADNEAGKIVQRALDLGINVIDTAEVYGMGRSERIVGRAILERRKDVFLATKVFPVVGFPAYIEWRARGSAKRLGVDRIDLYQQHWPNPAAPVSMTMGGMRKLRASGLVSNVGVSNFSLAQWQRADAALGAPVLSNQVPFSLVDRRPEKDLLPFAQREGRLIIAYSPLAQGFLSARYSPENRPTNGVRRRNALFRPEMLKTAESLFRTLRDMATRHGATPSQIALAWLVRQPNVVAIPGASSLEQVEANAAAAEIELNTEEDTILRERAAIFDRARA
ncbi:MAG: aldo/keto reductase [Actinomycetota bacterium]